MKGHKIIELIKENGLEDFEIEFIPTEKEDDLRNDKRYKIEALTINHDKVVAGFGGRVADENKSVIRGDLKEIQTNIFDYLL